jgi:hypothetical protein
MILSLFKKKKAAVVAQIPAAAEAAYQVLKNAGYRLNGGVDMSETVDPKETDLA